MLLTPSTRPKNMFTALPPEAVNGTVTCTAFGEVPPEVKACVEVLHMPSTTLEFVSVTDCPFALFSFAQAIASLCTVEEPWISPCTGKGRRIGDGLHLGFHPAQIADVNRECHHGQQEHHQKGRKNSDRPGTGFLESAALKHGHHLPFIIGCRSARSGFQEEQGVRRERK